MIKDIRDNDFRRRCAEILREMETGGHAPTLREVVAEAIETPAPSYYVSGVYAYEKVLRMLREDAVPQGNTPRERMWRELAERVAAERERKECTVARALSTVLNFRRPTGFFISEQEGLRIARGAFVRRSVYRPRRAARM